jgi:MAP/microtubule affinity-regulating kinase
MYSSQSLPQSLPQSSSPRSSPAALFLSSFTTATQPLNPDDEGQTISGYTLGDIIGYGSTSIIQKASSISGDVVAVKIIYRADLVRSGNAPQARKRLQHEASVWSSLSHEHILPLFSAVYTPRADYFITLYCPAGSLFDILKRDGTPALLQDDVGTMFRQVVRGLRYLHETSLLVHRDMKLENVLVDEMGMCRIADFGMSRKLDSDGSDDEDYPAGHDQSDMFRPGVHRTFSLSTKRQLGNLHTNYLPRHRNSTSTNQPIQRFQPGSLPYAAPELLLPQTSDAFSSHPRQDIWALGVMLYTLLTGRLPFADSFEPRLQLKILKGQFLPFLVDSVHPLTILPFSDAYEVPQDIGRAAERILQGCLEKNISNRWNIAMVDDVAWGVGWGAEGDDATHTKPDDEPELQHTNSRSRPTGLKLQTTIVWEQDKRSPSLTFSPAPSFSLERGRRTTESASRSRSPSFVPSTPPDGARVSPITGFSENFDFHLNSSTRETSSLQSSLDENSVAKPVQRTVGIEDEIANWTARTIDRDDDTEVNAMLEPKTLMTPITFTSDRQQQRSGSVPCSNLRWANANNTNNLYPERRPTPAEPFLNPGSTLPRSRSAEYRYFN